MANNSVEPYTLEDSHVPSMFFENDTVPSDATVQAPRHKPNSKNYLSAITVTNSEDDAVKAAIKDYHKDVSSETLSPYLFQSFSTTDIPSNITNSLHTNEMDNADNQSTTSSGIQETTGLIRVTDIQKDDVQFLKEYLSEGMLNTTMEKTDLSIHIFQTSDDLFPNWPRFQNGNPFTDIRIHAISDNVTFELFWQTYVNQTEDLRNCPVFKGTYRQSNLDSGNSLMLAFLRSALRFLQDKAGLILLSYISNYKTMYDDLLKITIALLQQSLSIFYAPSAPALPCSPNLFSDYDPDSFSRPSEIDELLISVEYHSKFIRDLQKCERSLRQSCITESEDHIKKLYEKVTIELLLIITALLIVPTILYSFTKVSNWITVYVSQLEERNSALAEKTAELDQEKSLTEKLLYEVCKIQKISIIPLYQLNNNIPSPVVIKLLIYDSYVVEGQTCLRAKDADSKFCFVKEANSNLQPTIM